MHNLQTHYEFTIQKYNKMFRLKKIWNAFLNYEFFMILLYMFFILTLEFRLWKRIVTFI